MNTLTTQETLGQRITRRRKELNLTRLQLAIAIGVVPSSVQAWEKDWHAPRLSIPQLKALCQTLQMTLDELSDGLSW